MSELLVPWNKLGPSTTGAGVSSPIVVGSRVFVTCYSGYGMQRQDPGDINPGTGRPGVISPGDPGATNGPGFGFEITPGVGLFGGASMHYYF